MTIEIDSKVMVKWSIILLLMIAFGSGGYYLGSAKTSKEYEVKIKTMENPIGDGTHFYLEERVEVLKHGSIMHLYHSTLKCKDIQNGTIMDSYGYTYQDNNKERYPYYFCPKCMNSSLINKLNKIQEEVYNRQGI